MSDGLSREDAATPSRPPSEVDCGVDARLTACVRGAVARVLGLDAARVPMERSLVALGLDSLAAAELAGAIEEELGVAVPLAGLLAGASLAELAAQVRQLSVPVAAGGDAAGVAPWEPAALGEAAGGGPLSYGQRAILALDRLAPGNAAYVIAGAAWLEGDLPAARLRWALSALVARHAALRVTFGELDGEGVQTVAPQGGAEWVEQDGQGWGAERRQEWLALQAHRSFDLARGPLLRLALLRLGAGPPLAVLAVHHLVADFQSLAVMLAELGALVHGRELPAPPGLGYADFVRREAAWVAGAAGNLQAAYWRELLARGAPALALPADRPRPALPTWRGGSCAVQLDAAAGRALEAAGRAAGATPFMTLLAVFQTLLHRLSGQDHVWVGTPAAGLRGADFAGVVGYFVNPLAVRGDLAGRPRFEQLLGRVREASVAAFAHQELPFALVAEQLAGPRDPSRPPIFQAMFVLYRERQGECGMGALALGREGAACTLGGLAVRPAALPRRAAQMDLTLQVAQVDGAPAAALQFNSDLIDAATARRWAEQLRALHAGAAADPSRRLDELPLLSPSERHQVSLEWNDTASGFEGWGGPGQLEGQRQGRGRQGRQPLGRDPGRRREAAESCLHELVEDQVRRTPDAIAVADAEGRCLSFGALNAGANQLARRLRRWGVGRESVVAICAERAAAAMVGLIAILKAGGAYLPLDPGYPAERLRFMLEDSGATVLLAQRRLAARLGEPLPAALRTLWLDDVGAAGAGGAAWRRGAARNLPAAATPDNLAYVIYTSGSTGRPKGTMNSHRGIVNRLLWMQQRYGLAGDDRVLQKTPWSFDVSVWELFWPLLTGARLVMALPGAHGDPAYLRRAIAAEAITTLHFVPAMLAAFVAALPAPSGGMAPGAPCPAAAGAATAAGSPDLATLRRVMASGEALPYELQQQHAWAIGAPLHNLYGPTEAAVDVTSWATEPDGARRLAVPPAVSVVPIGRPVANTWVRLLGAAGEEVPIGAAGELCIGGVQVCRGYLGRPGLTAERFVPDLVGMGRARGGRLYRTGDLARHLPDGAIDYLGRIDGQVKVRGFRVELGEIEAALRSHPAVGGAAVALRALSAATGAPEALVGYLTGDAGGERPDGEALRGFLAARLPHFMLPAAFVWLDRLPLSPAGKLDRRALPPPPAAGQADAATSAAAGGLSARLPATPAEELVASLFAELLALPAVGRDDDFFALGGHSLLATSLVSRLRQRRGVELPLRRIFETRTVAAVARLLDQAMDDAAAARAMNGTVTVPATDAPPSDLPTSGAAGGPAVDSTVAAPATDPATAGRPTGGAAALLAPPILPVPRDRPLPLSFAQQRLWFLDRLTPGSPLYNLPLALRLDGPLAPARLAAALSALVRRHEALRTVFALGDDGEPRQRVLVAAPVALPAVDLGGVAPARRDPLAAALVAQLALRPFDLAHGPLLRAWLLRLDSRRHVLMLALHHVAGDGWSLGLIVQELLHLYAAAGDGAAVAGEPLPDLPIQYADFAVWQRQWLRGAALDAQLAYWRGQLAGAPGQIELPADRPRPALHSGRGGARPFACDAACTAALRRLAQAAGGTLFMTLAAAFQLLLARFAGQLDVSVGVPIANRTRGETEGLVGMFVNTLVLRTRVAPEADFAALLASVRETMLAAYANQDLPFERLVAELQPERVRSQSPLFQVMLALQNPMALPPPAGGLSLGLFAAPSTGAKFDLTLALRESSAGLEGSLEYSRDLYDPATAERLAGCFGHLLHAAAGEAAPAAGKAANGAPPPPGLPVFALDLAGAAMRHQLLAEWGAGPVVRRPAGRLEHLVAEQVRRTPAAVAVVQGTEALSFGELDARAARLAARLRALGVGAEVPVGICAERSPALVVGLLAILKAGGAWLPLDPSYPAARLALMADDARIPVLLHDAAGARIAGLAPGAVRIDLAAAVAGRFAPGAGAPVPALAPAPADLDSAAYVIYTSGSTGKPKGVVISQRAICNHMLWMRRAMPMGLDDALLQRTPYSFDASVWEFLLPLITGARIALIEPAAHGDADRVLQAIADHQVTLVQMVPALLDVLLERPRLAARCATLRVLLCGGEPLTAELARRFGQRLGGPAGVTLWNMYGPTEATIEVTSWHWRPGDESERGVPIGRPLDNVTVAVLDATGRLAPPGAAGELVLGGPGVARGYLGQPERTAERFVPDPLGRHPGDRLYRTGDLVRFRPDGGVEFLGRADNQVKLRGFRIELGEIEAALRAQPGVEQAAVLVVAAPDRRLVACVAGPGSGGAPIDPLALRRGLRERLPEHMVPAAFAVLPALPLTVHGKLDRRALERVAAATTAATAAPPATPEAGAGDAPPALSPYEELVAGVWQQVLGGARPRPADHFFELGGHSLLATQLVSRLGATLDVDLPLARVFESPTLAGLAAAVAAAQGQPARAPIRRAPRWQGAAPLSHAQEGLWFLDRLEPGRGTYNMPVAYTVLGHLVPARFDAALSEIVRRHEILRTHFVEAGDQPQQRVLPPSRVRLPLLDLGGLPAARRAPEALRLAGVEARRPFDLARGPLLRGALLRGAGAGAGEHALVLNLHHIVADGWSVAVLVEEMDVLYRAARAGTPSPLPELPIQYGDVALWQRQWLDQPELDRQLAWWRQRLAAAPAAIELPTDRPRPAAQSYRGGGAQLLLDAPAAARLAACGRRHGATLFMTLLAGCAALLARWSRQDEVVVGTPIANRHHPETERLIGFFVNTLALRCDLTGDPSAAELLARVRATALAAYAHQDLPFDRLVADLRPQRLLGQNPVFQVMCALQNAPRAEVRLADLRLVPLALPAPTAKFDLALSWEERAGAGEGESAGAGGPHLLARLSYAADLFDAATMARLLGQLRHLLAGLVDHPDRRVGELPLLGAAERHQLLCEWNHSPWREGAAAGAADLVHSPFERRAAQQPDATAVVAGDRSLSYGQLATQARTVARRLRALGVGSESLVAICAETSFAAVAALFGVLRAGAAYLPLDPAHPPERLARLLAAAGAVAVLADDAAARLLPPTALVLRLDEVAGEMGSRLPVHADAAPPRIDADNVAYVFFTSGSTGTPKGVVVSHRAVSNRLRFQVARDLAPGARVLQRSRLAFDISVIEIFAPLWAGATLVLAPAAGAQDPALLARLLVEQQVTNTNVPPGMLPALLGEEALRGGAALRRVTTGGESVPADLPRLFAAAFAGMPAPPLLQSRYGPTEAAVSVSEWDCRVPHGGSTVPLGRPIAGSRLYVVDRGFGAAPPGVAGELCIGGVCLARCYHDRPDLTAAAFVPDPFAGAPGALDAAGVPGPAGGRLYRTGDLARRQPDGALVFLGRIDWQVKVRGFRIETGEIQSVLARHPQVSQAAVVARAGGQAGADAALHLVAYVVPHATPPAGTATAATDLVAELRRHAAAELPDYMVPAAFVVLDQLPLTANGKLDRAALPAPDLARQAAARPYTAPRTPIELGLAEVWQDLLGIDRADRAGRIGVQDSFFELGGHSLLAARLMARIRQRFGRELPVATLFRADTIERLAALLESGAGAPVRAALVTLTPPAQSAAGRAATLPLFCVHPAGGNVLCYAELARALGPCQAFYGLQLPDPKLLGTDPTIETIAAVYVAELIQAAPAGPCALAGWSLGGAIAFEMARQLQLAGRVVHLLALIDPSPVTRCDAACAAPAAPLAESRLAAEFAYDLVALAGHGGERDVQHLAVAQEIQGGMLGVRDLAAAAQAAGLLSEDLTADDVERLFALYRTCRQALHRYRPQPYGGPLTLLVAADPLALPAPGVPPALPAAPPRQAGRFAGAHAAAASWVALAAGKAEIELLPGDHYSIVRAPAVAALASRLRRRLAAPRTA